MRPYIKTLTSNVKSPRGEWTQNLGRFTYILGPNRSHKTTIIQAAELATTGVVDDMLGRDNVKAAAMLMSLKPADQAHLFSKATFSDRSSRSWQAESGTKPKTSGLEPAFIVSRLSRKLLSGSTEKLHEAMLDLLDIENVRISVTAEMNSSCAKKYHEVATTLRKRFGSEARVLAMVLEYAGKKQRELAAEAKGHKMVIDHYEDMGVESDYSRSDVPSMLLGDLLPRTPQARLLHSVLESACASGKTDCPACGSAVGAKHLSACSDVFEKHRSSGEVDLKNLIHRLESIFVYTDRWESLLAVKQQYKDCKERELTYKELKKACQEALKRLVEGAIDKFCSDVDRYLPGGWNLAYDKKLGALGLGSGMNGIFSSMSGAEWATVTAAMGCAIGDRLPAGHPQLLIVEDRAWDPVTLREVMIALCEFPGQVLMQGTIKPRGKMLKDWTLVTSIDFTKQFLPKTNGVVEPEPRLISSFTHGMLKALGFKEEHMKIMNTETAEEVASKGILAANVEIHDDGTWSLREGGNLHIFGRDD